MNVVERQVEVEREIVAACLEAMQASNWDIGFHAQTWKEKTGLSDAELGERIGLSKKQVQIRRQVSECFAGNTYSRLSWSHFAVAVSWEDADVCLEWADENEATVREMSAWRKAKRGEPLVDPPKPVELTEADLPQESKKEHAQSPVAAPMTETEPVAEQVVETAPEPRPSQTVSVPSVSVDNPVDATLKGIAKLPDLISDEAEKKRVVRKLRAVLNKLDPPKKFVPPTVEEVAEYCTERQNGIDPETFVAWGGSNGWKLSNGNKMQDWKSAIITWEKRDRKSSSKTAELNKWPQVVTFIAGDDLSQGYTQRLSEKFGAKVAAAVKTIGAQKIARSNEYQLSMLEKQFKLEMSR